MLLFISCDRQRLFEDYKDINNSGWGYESPAIFNYTINNVDHFYSFYLTIKHQTDYPFQNIYFQTTYHQVGETPKQDLFSVDLASNTGRWYGDCSAKSCKYEVLIQPHIKYDQTGDYVFTLNQNTRNPFLNGIQEVGLIIRKEE